MMKFSLLLVLSIVFELSTAARSVCENSKKSFRIELNGANKNRSCRWAALKSEIRCLKKTVNGTSVKELCPETCGNCPAQGIEEDSISSSEARRLESGGCCTLDYKNCITWCGSTEESCLTCSNTDVGWIPNGAPLGSCAARWSGCGHAKNSCCDGLTCQANTDGWFACLPGESTPTPPNPTNPPVSPTAAPVRPTSPPTNAPQPIPTSAPIPPTEAPVQPTSPPTNAPQPIPTNAPVPPTAAPVLPTSPPTNAPQPNPTTPPIPPTMAPVSAPTTAPNGNGCCSLDYKNCVSWCGSTYDSCVNCDNNDVVWLPDGPGGTCSERWSGCSQDSGCCNGLTCQWRDGYGYFACLPGGDGTPQSNPTNPPQPSPVSPPTDNGDWITGKATMYGGNPSGGACGYNDLPQVTFPKGFSVAVGGDLFDEGYGCGACFEVTCDGAYGDNPDCLCGENGGNKVIVQATDQCPECSSNHLDLNSAAFISIVKDQDPGMAGTCGIISTSFRRVSCDFKSNIKIRSKGGTSGFWYGLHIDDVAGYGAIQSVNLRESGRRQNGQNNFDIVCSKSEGASFWLCDRPNDREIFPYLDVELIDSAGRILRSNDVITNLNGDQEFDFGQNYGPIISEPTQPTTAPVAQPTTAPVVQPTPAPAPTTPFSGELLSTDKAMNAWEVYQGLDYITHKNSENPPNYALVASGGAAGGGNLVVSESQAYSLLITGAVLASWDTHAGQVAGANRNEVLNSFEGYYNFWKEMCKNSSGKSSNCQSGGNYCKSGSNSYVCLPDWRHYKTGGSEATGPAPDADEDAIVGIILAVKAVENDVNKPSWYDEARKWADASASAFYNFEVDKSRGDYRLVKLGSCWGGWDGAGNNPSYHSPGSFRVMKDYQNAFPENDRVGYSAVSQSDWQKLIDTSHEVMRVVQCSNDGALVPNWATIGISGENLVHTGAGFSGSGTPQYEYGSEAARTTFRVALDAAFYPENSAEWSPYLSQFNYRMDQGFSNGSISSNSFPSCRTPGTSQNINMFGDWQNNAFIFGPTYSALIGASSDIANAEAMIDSVGQKLNTELPGSYYPRSWAMISNLMLNGAMESAGKTLKQ